ncbi:MAG: hypothetical protein U1F76_03350 [Candidatus Competibacteraceae bacterium]
MIEDPIVKEIHKIRQEYAAKFGFDVAAICADYREREKKSKLKLVSCPPKRIAESAESA